jgi:iron(III) transport system ATP-binding protein
VSVRVEGVEKRFDETVAVAGVDLDIPEGEIVAVLGPSGCGKTTLLRLIAGFERPDAGTVTVGGETVAGPRAWVPPERRRIGMVFQDYALFPHLRVKANVAFGLSRRVAAERDALTARALGLVGLADKADRYPHELSGGERQRVALARALAPEPEIVLLDEPFSSLDATLRAELRRDVEEILRKANATALLVTHDQEEALSLADQVAVMRDGRIQQQGTPEEVYGRPTDHWVTSFLGDAEVLPGTAAGGAVECELGRFPVPAELEGEVDVVIRPESVALGQGRAGRGDRSHEGVVVAREYYGHDQLVVVQLESGRRVRSRSIGFPIYHPGDHVRVWVDGPVNALRRSEPGTTVTA